MKFTWESRLRSIIVRERVITRQFRKIDVAVLKSIVSTLIPFNRGTTGRIENTEIPSKVSISQLALADRLRTITSDRI